MITDIKDIIRDLESSINNKELNSSKRKISKIKRSIDILEDIRLNHKYQLCRPFDGAVKQHTVDILVHGTIFPDGKMVPMIESTVSKYFVGHHTYNSYGTSSDIKIVHAKLYNLSSNFFHITVFDEASELCEVHQEYDALKGSTFTLTSFNKDFPTIEITPDFIRNLEVLKRYQNYQKVLEESCPDWIKDYLLLQ